MANEYAADMFIFALVLSFVLVVVLFLFIRNIRLKKHFEDQATTLSTIYRAIPDLVYCMDINCRFTNCNRSYEEYTGFKESEVIGKTDIEIYANAPDPEMPRGFMETNKKVINEGITITTEETHIRPDNTVILLKSTKTPLIKNGKIIGLLGISRDITEHKAAIIAAQEASRAKSTFLAKMSHEIRTPLNAIIGMTELALRETEPEAAREHILTVKHEGVNLLSLVNDILDFSKIETGKLEILSGKYLFSSMVNDVINIIRMRVIDSQLRFAVFIDSKIPNELVGDEPRIRQILLNVLTNAVKYTDNGFVSFSICGEITSKSTVNLVVEVTDSGRGIKQEDINKLFGEYLQVDQEKNRGIEGVGLGLAITWNIVKAMNGSINVNSEYGKGSTFTISFSQKFSSPEMLASVVNPDNKHVIVYERRDIYAQSIIRTVRNLGVNCTSVFNDSELFEKMKDKTCDFLFTSFKLFEKSKNIILNLGAKTKTILFTEFGEIIPDKNINVIAMPVHCMSIANVLNGVADSFIYSENNENIIRFTAPKARILVVDDINTNLKVAKGLLSPYKMQIDLCKSGIEAIKAIKCERYDLVFMDHKMPGMDGIDTLLQIRALGESEDNKINEVYYKKVPIVALTANVVSEITKMLMESGFDDFISKPIDTIMLNTVLEKWIPKEKQKKSAEDDKYTDRTRDVKIEIEIDDLDINKGIVLSGGTAESYREALSAFCEDGLEKINEIKTSLEGENLPLYTTCIHGLKSAAATIGASGLSETAKVLEMAGKREDLTFIEAHNDKFLKTLEILLGKIKNSI